MATLAIKRTIMTTLVAALVVSFTCAHPDDARCCWSKWGTAATCGNYPANGKGGLCSTDWSKKCSTDTDCPAKPAPPPAPPPAPHPPAPPPPVPPHPPAPP